MSAETRKSPRYAVDIAITLRRAGGDAVTGRTSNVSSGGLCALVDQPVERGAGVEVEMALIFNEATTSEPLRLPARVVWATELGQGRHQVGVAFLGMSKAQHTYVDMFIRYLTEGAAHGDSRGEEDPFA